MEPQTIDITPLVEQQQIINQKLQLLIDSSAQLQDAVKYNYFFFGILAGILIGLIFWNLVKEVNHT